MMDDFTKVTKRVEPCKICRVGILTLRTDAQQDDGSWKLVKIRRNCGHVYESDPK